MFPGRPGKVLSISCLFLTLNILCLSLTEASLVLAFFRFALAVSIKNATLTPC